MEAMSIHQGDETRGGQELDHGLTSAHVIGHDSWEQVALTMVTSFNNGYILSFPYLMLVPLGWTWGIISLLLVGYYTAYANWRLAAFHFIDGVRFIRYRDLMGYVYGREMYYVTWILQFATILLSKMGFILLGGRALKEINMEFSDSPLRLQYFLIITALTYFIFSFFIPTISSMRICLPVSACLASTYIILILIVSIKDGKSDINRNYEISGSKSAKVFNGLGAIAAIIACNTSGMLPEIQSNVRRPAVENMRKVLYVHYTVGLIIYYSVSVVGYWAYGSKMSWYLPNDLSGPKWVKVLINLAVFLQSMISQQMFASPIHEALDTKFLKLEEGLYSRENLKRRLLLRAIFYTGNCLVASAFPFIGDFVNFFGSFALIPLTLMFPSMLFLKVKEKTARITKKSWHWFNIIFLALLTIATTIAAVRLIINNVQQYSFFADT